LLGTLHSGYTTTVQMTVLWPTVFVRERAVRRSGDRAVLDLFAGEILPNFAWPEKALD
jgi:hypothetical protein